MNQAVSDVQSSPKKFYFRFAMKNNFMNTNSTRFSEQFKQKMFSKSSKNQENDKKTLTMHTKKIDQRQIGKRYK